MELIIWKYRLLALPKPYLDVEINVTLFTHLPNFYVFTDGSCVLSSIKARLHHSALQSLSPNSNYFTNFNIVKYK